MKTRLAGTALAMTFVAALCVAPISAGAAPSTTTTPWVSVTLTNSHVERGSHVGVKFCWHNAPLGWFAQLTTGDNPEASINEIFSSSVAEHNHCVNVGANAGSRGLHPFSGQLLNPRGAVFVTTATILYVYGPTTGSDFLKSILHPNCHGEGSVVIGSTRYAYTCSMAAVTSMLTKTATSCRSVTFTLASTDKVNGDASSPGSSIFEIAQNQYAPFFSRFHDNVVTRTSLRMSGSVFWVAFKSTHPASHLYFLNQGSTADCYTASGTA
jgi:hypothetical protein